MFGVYIKKHYCYNIYITRNHMADQIDYKLLAKTPQELRAKFRPESINIDGIEILAGRGNLRLSREIARLLGKELNEPIEVFADGEKKLKKSHANLRRKGVFLLQSMQPHPDERLMEMYLMIDAARRASASDIAAVLFYPAYMRQDWKDQSRVPISATIPPRIFEFLGLNRMLSMELHSGAQQGFFDGPWDLVESNFVTVSEVLSRKLKDPIVAAPDAGGRKRAKQYSRNLGLGDNVVQAIKDRDVTKRNFAKAAEFQGMVRGKDIIIVEDIIDTAGTIIQVAKMFQTEKPRSIRVIAPYGIFSTDKNGVSAIKKIEDSPIDEVITTNAIDPKSDAKRSKKITYVDIAPMIAEAILCIHTGESISERLIL